MDYTLISESFGYSTTIGDDGDFNVYDKRNINDIKSLNVMASQFYLSVKDIRLTRFRLNRKRCKTQFILMLLGLWMNLFSVANGKCIISWRNCIISFELIIIFQYLNPRITRNLLRFWWFELNISCFWSIWRVLIASIDQD